MKMMTLKVTRPSSPDETYKCGSYQATMLEGINGPYGLTLYKSADKSGDPTHMLSRVTDFEVLAERGGGSA